MNTLKKVNTFKTKVSDLELKKQITALRKENEQLKSIISNIKNLLKTKIDQVKNELKAFK